MLLLVQDVALREHPDGHVILLYRMIGLVANGLDSFFMVGFMLVSLWCCSRCRMVNDCGVNYIVKCCKNVCVVDVSNNDIRSEKKSERGRNILDVLVLGMVEKKN